MGGSLSILRFDSFWGVSGGSEAGDPGGRAGAGRGEGGAVRMVKPAEPQALTGDPAVAVKRCRLLCAVKPATWRRS